MKRNVKIFAGALFILCISFFAIFILSQGEKREVKNLVIAYNNVLQKAHFELKSSLMEKLTTEKELRKIDNYMTYLYKNRRIFKGEIKDITFEDVKVDKDSATVVTKERWVYLYVDPATKQPVSEIYDVIYGNTYFLKKIEGHWVVDALVSKEIGGKAGE